MKTSNTALKLVVTDTQVQGLLAMRESLDSLKKRYELLENSVKAQEQEIIALVEAGATVNSSHELRIRATERRYPHWKESYAVVAAQLPSAPTTEEVLANTIPLVSKTLIIK